MASVYLKKLLTQIYTAERLQSPCLISRRAFENHYFSYGVFDSFPVCMQPLQCVIKQRRNY